MQEENRGTRKKPAESSMDWKPNARTAPGPGIEPGLSGAQRRERTATYFPRRYLENPTFAHCFILNCKNIIISVT